MTETVTTARPKPAMCTCGHSWIWHFVKPPQHCDKENCRCAAFTPVEKGQTDGKRSA